MSEQPKKQIVAMGGGGFSHTSKVSKIDEYILRLANKPYPKIAFLATATGDSATYIKKFYEAFSQADCLCSHYDIFKSNHTNIESFLLEQDIIYVGGGNTFNMITLWKARGVDKILKKAWEKGIILCGISAGSICWFESGNTDSFGKLEKIEGLGFLQYSNSPHYNSEPDRRASFQDLITSKSINTGYGVDDYGALHFIDQDLHATISESEDSYAYKTYLSNNKLVEDRIQPTKL
jgi:dipeptidase E